MKGITSLPDEVLYAILQGVRSPWDDMGRTTLPLVCKKWREVLYLQGEQQHLPLLKSPH